MINKIPKKIHYCWFGGNPMPELADKCIDSWKKNCPDYEIIEWNESNFDVNCCDYVKEAYVAKKWAFVSDYARFWILFHEGGLYFDTDVELLRPIGDLLDKGAFMGCETDGPDKKDVNVKANISVNPGLGLAAYSQMELYRFVLEQYQKRHFLLEDGTYDLTTVVEFITNILKSFGLKNDKDIQRVQDTYIYPTEYFCPYSNHSGSLNITPNTYSIHYFDGSWLSDETKARRELQHKYMKYMPDIIARCLSGFVATYKTKGLKDAIRETVIWLKRNK